MVSKQDNNPQNDKSSFGATPRFAGRSPNTNKKTALQARVHSLVNQEAAASEENPLSQGFDVVALTASADGLNALSCVLSALPANFPAAIVVVQHLSPRHPSLMAQILNRCTPLVVKEAKEGSQLSPGKVFIAPPDRRREGERGRGGEL